MAEHLLLEATVSAVNVTTNSSLVLDCMERHPNFYPHFAPAATFVDKFIMPVWFILGIPGNIMAFIIWIQPRMRPSSGCYLAALAMDDLIFLFFKFFFELYNTWHYPLIMQPVLCQAFPWFFLAAQHYAPLLVLGFTVERYISICHPFQREKFCTTRRALKVIIGLLFFSLLLHSVQAYFWHYQSNLKQCNAREAVLRGGNNSIWSVWSWITELLTFGVVPLAILALNIMVIQEVKKMSASEEKRMCLKKGHKNPSSHGSSSATTFMLLVVSFYLIFTTLPVTVCYAINLNFPEGNQFMTDEEINSDPVWQRHLNFWTVRRLLENFGMSHYACNFYLYLLTGKVFRREFRRIFLHRCLREDKSLNGSFNEMRQSQRSGSMLTSNGTVAHV